MHDCILQVVRDGLFLRSGRQSTAQKYDSLFPTASFGTGDRAIIRRMAPDAAVCFAATVVRP
jgi:hypothetical protein